MFLFCLLIVLLLLSGLIDLFGLGCDLFYICFACCLLLICLLWCLLYLFLTDSCVLVYGCLMVVAVCDCFRLLLGICRYLFVLLDVICLVVVGRLFVFVIIVWRLFYFVGCLCWLVWYLLILLWLLCFVYALFIGMFAFDLICLVFGVDGVFLCFVVLFMC